MMDHYWEEFHAQGAALALTADHGMNAKFNQAGEPDVLYLQSLLDEWLGAKQARVILPITDPYVVHHGALGSFATVYLVDSTKAHELAVRLTEVEGVEASYTNMEGCVAFDLPNDRLGDLIAS